MKENKIINLKYIFIFTFFLLNIINTYFLTAQLLNRYISPFEHTFVGELNSILGNISILLLILVLVNLIFKKDKNKLIALTVVTFVLNLLIFALGFFTLFYGTAFATNALDIFRNPAEGISHGMFGVVIQEFFLYFRFLIFIPVIALIIILIKYNYATKEGNVINNPLNHKRNVSLFLISALLFLTSTITFQISFKHSKLPVGATVSTYAVQNYGVYPFYMTNLFGVDFAVTSRKSLDVESDEKLFEAYDKFNKNKSSYFNIIDNKEYSNILTYQQTDNLEILNLNDGDIVNGIFKNKNLVLVHLESINHFLLEIEETNERLKFINALFKESYVFDNYYTSVGMGVSADAELSVLTGLYMNGYSTLYWDYNKNTYNFDTIPKLFNDKNYVSLAVHGDHEKFYNRDIAYPSFMDFSEPYQSLDKFAKDASMSTKDYVDFLMTEGLSGHKSPWVSDLELSEYVVEEALKYKANNQKHFIYNVHTMPHTPFQFNPFKDVERPSYSKWDNKISNLTRNYIDYVDYVDQTIERLFIGSNNENRIDEDTVYIFYGDHGSSLKNGDLSVLYDRELNLLEERKILQQVVAFIYAPSNEKVTVDGYEINKGIIKGKQSLVRSHIDMYRTIVDLFDLVDNSNFYFGVNGISTEPTFVIDNRIQDLIVDNPIDESDYIISLRNYNKVYPFTTQVNEMLLQEIVYFKKLSDLLLTDTEIYETLKAML